MIVIKKDNAADIIAQTNAKFFLIVMLTGSETFAWTGNGFDNIHEQNGFATMNAVVREKALQEFDKAYIMAMSNAHNNILFNDGGELKIVATLNFNI